MTNPEEEEGEGAVFAPFEVKEMASFDCLPDIASGAKLIAYFFQRFSNLMLRAI